MRSRHLVPAGVPLIALAVLPTAAAQPQSTSEIVFSTDFQGPLMGVAGNTVGTPISDADLLVRRGQIFAPDTPNIALAAAFLSAYPSCAGHLPGVACGLEINALSFGKDTAPRPGPDFDFTVYLSVDEFALGVPAPVGVQTPTVASEALFSDAAADVFAASLRGMGPFQPFLQPAFGVLDGDGDLTLQGQQRLPGLGLAEPLLPTPGVPETGDNLDALDIGEGFVPGSDTLYFSLQGAFPFCNEPQAPNFNAAAFQPLPTGFPASSAEVLQFRPGAGLSSYASPDQLGLDTFGFGTDDIDAVIVVENGVPGYQRPVAMYDWVGTNPSDLVLFSLRCGSQTLQLPDANFGLRMTEGDILLSLGGGLDRPGIFIPAERIGLQTAGRSGVPSDELDGMDLGDAEGRGEEPYNDCNNNGVEDILDIVQGTSMDCDLNGIPDECEPPGVGFCSCEVLGIAPCGNEGTTGRGCVNATGVGALMTGMGTSSIVSDFLSFDISDMPPLTFGLLFAGEGVLSVDLSNGRRCVGPGMGGLHRLPIFQANIAGSVTEGPGLLSALAGVGGPTVMVGSTWGFQAWYRDNSLSDPLGPCDTGANLTNAWSVTFTP